GPALRRATPPSPRAPDACPCAPGRRRRSPGRATRAPPPGPGGRAGRRGASRAPRRETRSSLASAFPLARGDPARRRSEHLAHRGAVGDHDRARDVGVLVVLLEEEEDTDIAGPIVIADGAAVGEV